MYSLAVEFVNTIHTLALLGVLLTIVPSPGVQVKLPTPDGTPEASNLRPQTTLVQAAQATKLVGETVTPTTVPVATKLVQAIPQKALVAATQNEHV